MVLIALAMAWPDFDRLTRGPDISAASRSLPIPGLSNAVIGGTPAYEIGMSLKFNPPALRVVPNLSVKSELDSQIIRFTVLIEIEMKGVKNIVIKVEEIRA